MPNGKTTTLVLGAGSSADYGYPTGRGLKAEIAAGLSNLASSLATTLIRVGNELDEVTTFAQALAKCAQPSVDALLEQRPEFVRIGKEAIAAALIPREVREDALFNPDAKKNWYEYLFSRFASRWAELKPGELSIVTFNYDRSLEHFLRVALQNSYGTRFDQLWPDSPPVRIHHVHGILGEYPWGKEAGRPFGNSIDGGVIREAAEAIRIVAEKSLGDAPYLEARELILRADRVFFVGFGFHEQNVDRLQVRGALPGVTEKRFFSSNLDFTLEEQARYRRRMGANISFAAVGQGNVDALRQFDILG